MRDLYNKVKGDNRDRVVLVKEDKCYKTYSDDTFILWHMLNYKIKDGMVRFASNNLLELLIKLHIRNIPVVCVINDSEIVNYNVDGDSKYSETLNGAKMFYELENDPEVIKKLLRIKLGYDKRT